ncbi:MAG: hypothetical protein IAB81_02640 [Bacteroidetes bacterium]|uniref:Uncharacterized protein n=1 Tax=Candidatus Merdivivens pullicola TaxID=2840872 RepID=A0A9D9IJ24_9BACT|nr:hypothetical protein [Candidatus Merdivivens pullicola]
MRLIDYVAKPDTREFLAVFHEENSIELNQIRFKMTDKWDLNEDTPEVRIAICEKVEEIDRLEVGQSIPFNPFRGEKAGNGFILRMK